MIRPESIIIGISISIIMIKCFKYYIFESKVWSTLVYILGVSFLFEIISKDKNKGVLLEGYSSNNDKHVEFEESDSFKGKKDGYVFKKGEKGLGYYLDK
tara:strand:- start:758 stop:1054 length:297 start_codon:yes stop_codon:yes gene_type:complete